ncbi:MAG: hypothetical protein J5529_01295 [Prevotella sp.]|nr:hypothetical protein [Prevotella sp.]
MPSITLYIPQPKALYSLSDKLEYNNTRDVLKNLAKDLSTPLLNKHILYENQNGAADPPSYVKHVFKSSNVVKEELAQFCAMMLYDERNMKAFFDAIPEKQSDLYRALLQHHYISMNDITERFGIQPKESSRYSWERRRTYEVPFLTYNFSGYDKHWDYTYQIGLTDALRPFFYKALLPGQADLISIDELPEGFAHINFELSTIRLFPVVEALIDRDILEYGNHRYNAASVKRAGKQLGAEEFFTDKNLPKEMLLLRNSFMLQSAGIANRFSKKNTRLTLMEEKLKYMMEKFLAIPETTYPLLLNYITGLRSTMFEDCYGKSLISSIVQGMKTLPMGKWVSVDSLLRHLFMSTDKYYLLRFTYYTHGGDKKFANKFSRIEHSIDYFHQIEEMGIPYCRGLLFVLASWGLLEMGCHAYNNKKDVSPYDTMEYIRLTNLGDYVFGRVSKYEAPQIANDVAYFDLDPERLIIRSLQENNPYESLLSDTCIPIGNRRYKMNEETFLSRCHNRSDVEEKISFFKRYISGDLSPVWEAFFTRLLNRCKPLKPLVSSNYHIYTLSSDNQQLIHLLNFDPILRPLIIKAENYIFLVESSNQTKFENRLKSLGYLI